MIGYFEYMIGYLVFNWYLMNFIGLDSMQAYQNMWQQDLSSGELQVRTTITNLLPQLSEHRGERLQNCVDCVG